jgi:hypothetical protein
VHKPALDMSLFALPVDVRVWLFAVWCLGIWCMDNEGHPLACEAWDIQRQHWSEETDLHVVTAPTHFEWPNLTRDHPLEAPSPAPSRDADERTQVGMMTTGWPGAAPYEGQPPRVAIYRIGPKQHDVFLAFGDYVTWRWM